MRYECVMCGDEAEFVAKETNEFLCTNCNANNNEIRTSKGLKPSFLILK